MASRRRETGFGADPGEETYPPSLHNPWRRFTRLRELSLADNASLSGDASACVVVCIPSLTALDLAGADYSFDSEKLHLLGACAAAPNLRCLGCKGCGAWFDGAALRALLEMRFRRDHAQQACAFVFAEHAGSLAGKDTLLIGALDWLCLHVDDKHLPRQFASVSRIEVVNSGVPKGPAAVPSPNSSATA